MGIQKWSDDRFGERVKQGRTDGGWSQAEMAKLLADNGVQPMHATTIAKIEAGDRSVRINEAVGIADLFGVSLDTLMGRSVGPADADFAFALRVLRDTARRSSDQALDVTREIQQQARHIAAAFDYDGLQGLQKLADTACRRLNSAYDAVEELALETEEALRAKTAAARKQPKVAKVVKA
ncbi:helix-turn-helix domain-containing protein [Mycobacterium sp. AZCC_0083]|uniref:helix-turn-helix domain-containing protein n=1 Tax=Mycobacterium sp. AZCC_0083 TaxID=2735882 RepID=UPI001619B4C0|nr:helix-turn-helix transcriptional regulator [Mycobacterium sp. AZCC_0083]MBB5161596.1 transcriptional regulator with XRE-family HTH domain [Mycobacterium sp. AZCC_0083]